MATVIMNLSCKLSWWVRPYLMALKLFIWSVAPFIDEDDERFHRFIHGQMHFIIDYGVKLYADGRRI